MLDGSLMVYKESAVRVKGSAYFLFNFSYEQCNLIRYSAHDLSYVP